MILGIQLPLSRRAAATRALAPAGSLHPNAFLRIGADSTVTILSKHFEMGQGVTTGLATLVAEELDADWAQMRFAFAPHDPTLYNNLVFGPYMMTGGTSSIYNSWEQMRKVGAAARAMLVAAAAARWDVPSGEVSVRDGILSHAASQRSATFGELAATAAEIPVPSDVALKEPKDWKLIGKRLPRLDGADKITGRAQFASDLRRPGELVAIVRRPDLFGAKVRSFDDRYTRLVRGVVDVVQVPSGVAVLAADTWSAMTGRDVLSVAWDASEAEQRSTGEILDEFRTLAQQPGLQAVRRGDAARAIAGAVQVLEVEFAFPYLAHTPMEPINAIMELRPDGAEVWSGSQLQTVDATFVAKVLGLQPGQVKINTLIGGGSFGRRGNANGDWIIELAEIAKAIGGRAPVHLVWTREDDIKGGYYRPLTLHRVRVGLDAAGGVRGWQHRVVCQPIGAPVEETHSATNGIDRGAVDGLVNTSYDIPDFSLECHNAEVPVPVLWWRSVGNSHTAHVVETVVDELARRAGKDPVAFRRALLARDPRGLAVLDLAAAKAGWGRAIAKGRGRGIAFHRSYDTRVAMVAEVSVGRGGRKVERIVCAVDCGVAVNPDVIEAQMEGSVGFALSSVLRNAITLDKGTVEQGNFDDYEPTRFSEMPRVEVHIVKSLAHPTGVGEPGVPPLAPAIGNAIFAATGKRLYSLPFDLAQLG